MQLAWDSAKARVRSGCRQVAGDVRQADGALRADRRTADSTCGSRHAPGRDGPGEPVELAEFLLQVLQIWFRSQRGPGRLHDDLVWEKLSPVGVDVLAQPAQQSGELAARDLLG